ncbi:MAG: class GN sortase [Thermoanaerobaculia bacterium]
MRLRFIMVCLLSLSGVGLFGNGAWMYAKARLAQYLLQRAWTKTLRGERDVKPWRWADTWPIAKIDFPDQHKQFIVLSGASGRTMAFGPGHVDGTADPDQTGNCVISAHRDTQFAVLRQVQLGDEIVLETRKGVSIRYRVRAIRVVRARDVSILAQTGGRRLTLVTCYPFDGLRPGSELRYAVMAMAS